MLILPNQAGVALGLFAFIVASLVSIFSGVTLEVAILRGVVAFLVFLIFGWLMAYIIYEEKKPEAEKKKDKEIESEVSAGKAATNPAALATAAPESAAAEGGAAAGGTDIHGLETPDDSDF